jgi:rod shape-determining protein MreC
MTGAGLAVALLILLNLPESASRAVKTAVREAAAPLQGLWADVALRAREGAATVRGLGGLAERNRELEAELLLLRGENRELQVFREENEQLRTLLGYPARTPRALIAAEIIARDASGWWQSLRIGRGAHDGLAPGRAVVTPDGLVGRTLEITPRTAEVLLLTDPSSRIAAEVPRAGAFGIVSGQGVRPDGRPVLRMDYLDRHREVRPGDAVLTSGLGGVFPRGLLIGYIGAAERGDPEALGLHQGATVLPRVELGALRHVFVLADPPEPPPPLTPVDPVEPEAAP